MENVAPLSGGFMATSLIGLLISAIKIYPSDKTWGFTFIVFFSVMFISSLVSMAHAPIGTLMEIDKK